MSLKVSLDVECDALLRLHEGMEPTHAYLKISEVLSFMGPFLISKGWSWPSHSSMNILWLVFYSNLHSYVTAQCLCLNE